MPQEKKWENVNPERKTPTKSILKRKMKMYTKEETEIAVAKILYGSDCRDFEKAEEMAKLLTQLFINTFKIKNVG